MLRSTQELFGYKIKSLDGQIGKVDDFYFDDQTWIVRYMVADTGGWLSGRKVLILPSLLGQPDWASQNFPVSLTKHEIEKSPDIDLNKPVSRQHETHLYEYYKKVPYWLYFTPQEVGAVPPVPSSKEIESMEKRKEEDKKEEKEEKDYHLRSIKEVIGYDIEAEDGGIGHVKDFVMEDVVKMIRYMIVDTKNWLPGRKVLISPEWIKKVSWGAKKVLLDMTRDMVEKSPEFDPSQPINRKVEERLYDFYGRPKYWI